MSKSCAVDASYRAPETMERLPEKVRSVPSAEAQMHARRDDEPLMSVVHKRIRKFLCFSQERGMNMYGKWPLIWTTQSNAAVQSLFS